MTKNSTQITIYLNVVQGLGRFPPAMAVRTLQKKTAAAAPRRATAAFVRSV